MLGREMLLLVPAVVSWCQGSAPLHGCARLSATCTDYGALITARPHVQPLLHTATQQRDGQAGIEARRLLDLTKG